MMVNVGSFDAKTHLPALLKRVSQGETVQITRRGVPVAKLVPVERDAVHDPQEAARRIRESRRGIRLQGLDVRDLIREGRHF